MYSRRDLVQAYLGAQNWGYGGYYTESPTFNAALEEYYVQLLDGLQKLFGLQFDMVGSPNPALMMLFRSTAESLLALRTPWSGFLESGLLVRKLEEAGEHGVRVTEAGEKIDALIAEAREAHLTPSRARSITPSGNSDVMYESL
ncbi:hypothetical protein [Winogradskya humida]|uniref:Uncharacterized protein n=1 Tax=Winogradskya humida TaxID=113566 RepID=A0ABQ3ZI16_9ACTN|nr:hypothetical protein [Actinoplanes humidus]GIE18231.1 hypothetical protein Ahu01nite_013330 [Actinoplanes humidus]